MRDKAGFVLSAPYAWTFTGRMSTACLSGIWGSSPADLFAVGDDGAVLRFDGSAWSVMRAADGRTLSAVWGSAPNDVFAVGAGGTILHYDGNSWTPISSAVGTDLFAVWGFAGTDVLAAGRNCEEPKSSITTAAPGTRTPRGITTSRRCGTSQADRHTPRARPACSYACRTLPIRAATSGARSIRGARAVAICCPSGEHRQAISMPWVAAGRSCITTAQAGAMPCPERYPVTGRGANVPIA